MNCVFFRSDFLGSLRISAYLPAIHPPVAESVGVESDICVPELFKDHASFLTQITILTVESFRGVVSREDESWTVLRILQVFKQAT